VTVLVLLFLLSPFLLFFGDSLLSVYKAYKKNGVSAAKIQLAELRKINMAEFIFFSGSGVVGFLFFYFIILSDIQEAGSFRIWLFKDFFGVVIAVFVIGVIVVVIEGGSKIFDHGCEKIGSWRKEREIKRESEIKGKEKEVLMRKNKGEVEVIRESQKMPASSGDPFADLHNELYNLMQRNDQNALVARIASIKKTMDAGTFERNINAWLRKYRSGIEAMDAVLEAERKKGELKRIGLEQKLEQAKMEADIEECLTRAERAKVEREKLRESPPRQKSKTEQIKEAVNLEIVTFMEKIKKGVSKTEARRDLEKRFSRDEVEAIMEAAERELSEEKYRHL